MNKNILIGAVTGTVVLGAFSLMVLRRRKKKSGAANVTPRLSGDNSRLQSVTVQESPDQTSSQLYDQYKEILAILDEPSTLTQKLRETKQLRPLNADGSETIKDADTLMEIQHLPERVVSKDRHEKVTLYEGIYQPEGVNTAVLVVKFAEHVWVLSMPTVDRFVAIGPYFENCDSLGYLSVLLDALIETFKLAA